MKKSYMWIDPVLPRDHAITGLNLPLESALDRLAELGFEGIELMIGDPELFKVDEFQKAVHAHRMEISQICTGELFGSYGLTLNDPDASARKTALHAAAEVVALAGRLECKVGIGRFRGRIWAMDHPASYEAMADSFGTLDLIAHNAGIEILLEPLRPDVCDTINTVSEASDFINECGLKNFGWLLDTDHVGLDQKSSILKHAASLGFVHLADTRHLPLGRGNIEFPQYLGLLQELGFSGFCSVEVFADGKVSEESFLAEMAGKLSGYFENSRVMEGVAP